VTDDEVRRVGLERADANLPQVGNLALRARLRRGWPPRLALTVPVGERSTRVHRRDRAVLGVLRDSRLPLSRVEVAARVGCSVDQAWRSLSRLRDQALVGRTMASMHSVWWATCQR
jgi:hypothetical protein